MSQTQEPLGELPLSEFLDRLASGAATPGGGSAAALVGALAAALASMVCNLTIGKSEFAEVEPEAGRLLDESEALRAGLEFGIEADAGAFAKVASAYRLPRASDEQKQARTHAIRRASKDAAREPLEVARLCARVLNLCSRLAEIGNPRVLSDVVVSAVLARAALHGASANVEVNLPSLKGDPFWDESRAELDHLLDGRGGQVETILARVSKRA